MGEKTVYLDHAATSWPKPTSVRKAVDRCMGESGGNPGRGSHRLAVRAAEEIFTCRELAGQLFDCAPERVVCTAGATAGINMAIDGFVRQGDHVLISNMSHNAVYRPVYALARQGRITFDLYTANGTEEECLRSIAARCTPQTRLVVVTHGSNICGNTEPLEAIGAFCRQKGILLVADGAQSGGHLPISVDRMGITALCLPGHKGLLGPQGCGLLLLGKDAPDCAPLVLGGSGSRSLEPGMPGELPEHLEAGTLPTPALAGLAAGIRTVLRETTEGIHRNAVLLGNRFCRESAHLPGIRFYGKTGGSVISFTVDGYSPARIAEFLNSRGICVRSGYHCAPLAHRALGSIDTGTVRVSFGYGNTRKDVQRLVDALYHLQRDE